MGYSYTADPEDAIRDIWAYHKKNPPKNLTGESGVTYDLVRDLDLNKGVGGDYIYLYTTKNASAGKPVIELSVGYDVVTGTNNVTWVNEQQMKTDTARKKPPESSRRKRRRKRISASFCVSPWLTSR